MRLVLAVVLALASASLSATPAMASCAPPAPLPDRTARAVAVVYGTVTATDTSGLTLRVDRSLKGQLAGVVRIFVGPGRGGAGGTAVATSVDYRASVGSDHVLYVLRGDDGALETNACSGSHPGPPDTEEISLFGSSSSGAQPASSQPVSAFDPARSGVEPQLVAALLLAVLLAGGTAVLLRRRVG